MNDSQGSILNDITFMKSLRRSLLEANSNGKKELTLVFKTNIDPATLKVMVDPIPEHVCGLYDYVYAIGQGLPKCPGCVYNDEHKKGI